MQLDKAKIRQSFAAAASTYDGVAKLQRTVGLALLDAADPESLAGTLLDLGCGTGFLTAKLAEGLENATQSVSDMNVIALDIALPMVQATQRKLLDRPSIGYLCADAERLPLVGQTADAVFSNLALQWCVNLAGVFTDIKRVLKPGGRLTFSTFGPQTLRELKAAWATVDDYQHVNDFYSEQQLRRFLESAGYSEIKLETRIYTSSYASVWDLMHELKHIGAHNMVAGRNKSITTRSALQRMIAAYEQPADERIFATYEIFMVTARI